MFDKKFIFTLGLRDIPVDVNRNYYDKYLKYKRKYIELKNKLSK